MLPRFFAPDAGATASDSGGLVTLPEEEAVHLTRVLRLGPGDQIRVFDGKGREWRGEIAEASRQRAIVRVLDAWTPAREPRIAVTVAMAVLKGDKMDDVVRDSVMLGAAAIIPLVTTRTEISLAAIQRSGRIARWQRIAVASAKQCGRAVVPPIEQPLAFEQFVRQPPTGERFMLVEPGASHGRDLRDLPSPTRAELVIGPEGGWDAAEIEIALATGATAITLGGLTLRADAVPVVALTALRTVWNDL